MKRDFEAVIGVSMAMQILLPLALLALVDSGARLFGLCSLFLAFPLAAKTAEGNVAVGNGIHIHYVEAGDRGAKRTFLFVPGWSMSTAVWEDQLARFASAAHVVSIDPRSQGQSTVTTRFNTPEQRAQDLHRVIQSLKLTNIVLVGWSQGVQDVAAYAAAFEGDGVAGYVLVDAPVASGPADAVAHPGELQQQLERFAIYEQFPKQYLAGMMNAIIRSPEGRKRIDDYVKIGLRTPPACGLCATASIEGIGIEKVGIFAIGGGAGFRRLEAMPFS